MLMLGVALDKSESYPGSFQSLMPGLLACGNAIDFRLARGIDNR